MDCVQERNTYKTKWQHLLSQHTSAHTTIERLQRDVQQQSHAYADLQKVNNALEGRLLGHSSAPPATAAAPAYGQAQTARHSSFLAATASRSAGSSPDSQGNTWQPQPVRDSPIRNSPYGSVQAAARQHDMGCPGSPAVENATRGGNWNDSTSRLDSLLAEHQQRLSPGHSPAAQQSTAQADAASVALSRTGLSSEEIMARLTRSPEHASAKPADNWGTSPSFYRQPPSSGLQSPPDMDAAGGNLPTKQLRTALFGTATAKQQRHDTSAAAGRTSAALQHEGRQQTHPQDRSRFAQGRTDGFGAQSNAHHHQTDSNAAQASLQHPQDVPVWHNARPWTAAAPQPDSAKGFSLHTNPLAELSAQQTVADDAGVADKASMGRQGHAAQQHFAALTTPSFKSAAGDVEGRNDLQLSLADLAVIDPNSL